MRKKQKVRKLRSTKGSEFNGNAVKVDSLRTQQACNRALVYLERSERRAFNKALRKLKPQIEHWLKYLIHTRGKDSADVEIVMRFWQNMTTRYKHNRAMEKMYAGEPPAFDPDINGERYG